MLYLLAAPHIGLCSWGAQHIARLRSTCPPSSRSRATAYAAVVAAYAVAHEPRRGLYERSPILDALFDPGGPLANLPAPLGNLTGLAAWMNGATDCIFLDCGEIEWSHAGLVGLPWTLDAVDHVVGEWRYACALHAEFECRIAALRAPDLAATVVEALYRAVQEALNGEEGGRPGRRPS